MTNPGETHDGRQRLKASNHFGFPCSRMRRVSKAHNRFRSPARRPIHVSESAMTLMLGLPSSPFSTVNFPSRIVTVASAGSSDPEIARLNLNSAVKASVFEESVYLSRSMLMRPRPHAEPDGVERGQEGKRQHRANGSASDQHISHGSPEH